MPKKIKELKSLLLRAGFIFSSGKGSHTKWSHPLLPGKIVLSGSDGTDAKYYQEKDVNNVLQKLEEIEKEQQEEK